MNRLFPPMIFILMVVASFGQDISRREADSLSKLLAVEKTDAARMDLFFRLAEFHMFKPGENSIDLDSAKLCIEKAAVLNAKMKSPDAEGCVVLLNSLLAREKAQMKEGKAMAESAVSILQNGVNKFYLGKAYFALSAYYNYGNTDESAAKIQLVERAVKAFAESGKIESQAFTLTFLADLYYINDERPKALKKLDTALALYKSIQYERLQSVYALYSTIYYLDGSFKQSLNYALMALKNVINTGDTSMTLCQVNNRVGIILHHLKEPGKAIGYFLEAYRIAKKNTDNSAVLFLTGNIVDTYINLKKPDIALTFMHAIPEKLLESDDETRYIVVPYCYMLIYYELKKFDKAQVYAGRILEGMKTRRTISRELNKFYTVLIKIYMESSQYGPAVLNMNKLDSLSGTMDPDITREKSNFELKFRLDTVLGNYKSAVTNLLAYQKLNDSIFNENSNRQIKELEIEYETEKNRSEITVLNQKNQLSQSRLDREKLVKNFTIGGIALLSVIIVLLYRLYRHKQHSNTVIVHKNEQLQHLLTEKEWLVKEIHHRVKNNFHIVSSLLEIQSSYLKNKEALSAIKESQNRIHSMSIIHQKLYQSETLSTIHMPEYIYELVEHLRDSYGIRENIRFSLQIEPIHLNHASAITLGLILNEAITNAIKYAFSKNQAGKIFISLNHISDAQIMLTIADNGRGLPPNMKSNVGSSMGMELLQGLADDIGGSLSIGNNDGTQIKILFTYKTIANSDTTAHINT